MNAYSMLFWFLVVWGIGLLFTIGYLLENMRVIFSKARRGLEGVPTKERIVATVLTYVVASIVLIIAWPIFLGEEVFLRKNKLRNWDHFRSN